MPMAANEIEALIKASIPDARVTVEDLAGDGDHYAATVVSEVFRGIPRVKQHQIVYAALRGRMGVSCTPSRYKPLFPYRRTDEQPDIRTYPS